MTDFPDKYDFIDRTQLYGIELDISITYDSCLTCQLSANDKEGRKKHSYKSALDMEGKK